RRGHVVAPTVAGPGREPERVVPDQRDRMRREEPLARLAQPTILHVVEALGRALDAAEARERIAGEERDAGLALEIQVPDRVLIIPHRVERAEAVVPAVLEVDEPG